MRHTNPVQVDPLDSPHPVPWSWVTAMISEARSPASPRHRYYRSQSLVSPDGEYAAYSRIQIQLSPDFTQNRVVSVMFLENLHTGDLQTISATSPFADNPFTAEIDPTQGGTIAIVIPVAWSASGDRLLSREFESIFGSGVASDFALVWERRTERSYTIAPSQISYSNAVLLGWSQACPGQVLFRAGHMGDPDWGVYTVGLNGETACAVADDRPVTFGELVSNIWAGPQAYSHV